MKKLALAATTLAVAAALAGCGRNDDATTTASTDTATSASTSSTPSSTDSTVSSTSSAPPVTASSDSAQAPATTSAADASSSTAPAPSSTTTDASATATAPATATTAMGAGASGQTVYGSTCAMCHAAGVAGAPKPGDKADWKPRIDQGKDTLYTHAIKGYTGKKGMMPPKGGNTSIPDADVKAAVDYMVEQSK